MARPLVVVRNCIVLFSIFSIIGLFTLNASGESVGVLSVNGKPSAAQGTIKKISINGGEVITLATGLDMPFALGIYDDHIYFSEAGTGTIKKISIDGGQIATLADGLRRPRGLLVDDGWVYFAETGKGAIKKVSIDGGKVITIAEGLKNPGRLAADSDYLYICEFAAKGDIKKIPKHATNARAMALTDGIDFPTCIILIDKNIFFIEHSPRGRLLRMSTEGGAATVLLQNLNRPTMNAVDRTHLYLMEVGGTIQKVPLAGGDATVLASNLKTPAGAPVIDEENVYFVDNLTTIRKVSKNGGASVTLADGFHEIFAMTVHDHNLYFTEGYIASRDDKESYP